MSDQGVNLDQNTWYHISVLSNPGQYVIGTYLYANNGSEGTIFNQNTGDAKPEESKWQFFPVGKSFVLRTQASGSRGFLHAAYDIKQTYNNGKTSLGMANSSYFSAQEVDGGKGNSSMFWNVGFWNDGSTYLWNRANDSDWRMLMKGDAFPVMDRNLTGPPDGMKFNFSQAGNINDKRFSSIVLATAGGDSTATLSNSPTSAPTGDPASGSDGGLSTGAQAGIGVGVGLVALAAIILGVWFFLRRRKHARTVKAAQTSQTSQYHSVDKKLMPHAPDDHYAELGGETTFPTEMSTEGSIVKVNDTPVELASEPHR